VTNTLMISLDTTIFTGKIGNTRARHEGYAQLANGHLSMVVLNRAAGYTPLETPRLSVHPTESRGLPLLRYWRDGVRTGLVLQAAHPAAVISSQDPFLSALIALRLKHRTGKPLIIQDHSAIFSSPYFVREHPRNYLARTLGVLMIRQADAVRVVSRRERLACIRYGIRPSAICVIPVATETAAFAADPDPDAVAAWRVRLGITEKNPTILWVGRPVAFKNLSLLLTAFQRIVTELPEARLILAGDMNGTNYIGQAAARGLGDAVKFPGTVPYGDLPALFHAADVYALSSNYEGFGRVLVEAGAAGLPVVATDTAGAADVVADGLTGAIVPIGNAEKLAEALLLLLRHPVRRKQFATRARQHVQANFEEGTLTRKWVEMWHRLSRGLPPCALS